MAQAYSINDQDSSLDSSSKWLMDAGHMQREKGCNNINMEDMLTDRFTKLPQLDLHLTIISRHMNLSSLKQKYSPITLMLDQALNNEQSEFRTLGRLGQSSLQIHVTRSSVLLLHRSHSSVYSDTMFISLGAIGSKNIIIFFGEDVAKTDFQLHASM